jgi:hypothetical protein
LALRKRTNADVRSVRQAWAMTLDHLPHDCEQMRMQLEDVRVPVGYSPQFREYWIGLIAGHDAVQLLMLCNGAGPNFLGHSAARTPMRLRRWDSMPGQS